MKVLLASMTQEALSGIELDFKGKKGSTILSAETGKEALALLQQGPVDLVILNHRLTDMSGREFIRRLLSNNPLANFAVASDLPPNDFHKTYEGCGVLMQLSLNPESTQIKALLNCMEKIRAMMARADSTLLNM